MKNGKKLKHILFICLLTVVTLLFCACDNGEGKETGALESNKIQHTESETEKSCAHSFGEWKTVKAATCRDEGVKERGCAKCPATEQQSIEKSEIHTEKSVPGRVATCAKDGLTDGKLCTVCNQILVEQISIPKTEEHTSVTDAAVPATCKNTGLTEGSHCSVCKKVFVAQTTVPKTEEHTPVTDAAVPATCKNTGLTEGSHCSVCDKVFVVQTVVPKTEDHTPVTDAAVPPSCKNTGLTEGSHCNICNQIMVKQVEIPKEPHNYVDGYCDACNAKKVSEGLQFEDYNGYAIVTGIGSCTDTVIIIPDYAPSGLPVREIGRQAFQNCTSIKEVVIPDAVGAILSAAFMNCTSLEKITLPSACWDIQPGTFSNCTALKEVTIPNNIFRIGAEAFANCTSLESVTIPTSVTTYAKDAFMGCAIKNLYISSLNAWLNSKFSNFNASPLYYAENLYINQALVTTLEINQNIPFGAFAGYERLTKVVLGNSVETIGRSAFADCSGLTEVVFGNKVETIDAWAFSNCTNLNDIHLPSSLKTISNKAFYECSSLQTITVANGLQSLGDYAFGGCSALRAIDLPATITYMGISSFEGCAALESITIPFVGVATCSGQYEAFGSLFGSAPYEGGEVITQIKDSVGTQSFEYSYCIPIGLKHVKVLKHDEYSSTRAFVNCKYIESITFAKGVTRVGTSSIVGCTALTDIYYEGTKEEWGNLRYSEPFLSLASVTVTCSDGVVEKPTSAES